MRSLTYLILFATILMPGIGFSASGTVILNLTNLDNRSCRIIGPGSVDETFSTSTSYELSYSQHGSFSLELNINSSVSSVVGFSIDEEGNIGSLTWKDADESQTGGGAVSLPSPLYEILGNKLYLYPYSVGVDIDDLDSDGMDFNMVWFPHQASGSGMKTHKVFPGDYEFVIGHDETSLGVCRVKVEVLLSSGEWGSSLSWKSYASANASYVPDWQTLPTAFYSVGGEGKELSFTAPSLNYTPQFSNAEVRFHGNAANYLSATVLKLFPGSYDIDVGKGLGLSAHIQLQLDPSYNDGLGPVFLELDSQWLSLDTAFVDINSNGDSLFFRGKSRVVDLSYSDNSVVCLALSTTGLSNGLNSLSLFPGQYSLNYAAADLHLYLDEAGDLLPDPVMESMWGDSAITETLGLTVAHQAGDTLRIAGQNIEVNLGFTEDQELYFEGVNNGSIGPGGTGSFYLLPGVYDASLTAEGGSPEVADLRFEVKSGNAYLKGDLWWQDPNMEATPEGYEVLGPDQAFFNKKSLTLYEPLPPEENGPAKGYYAILKRKLDAGYYVAGQGHLLFKYDERYNPSVNGSDLDFQIYEENQHVVLLDAATWCGSVTGSPDECNWHYGLHWVDMDLGSTGLFTNNAYYVLEVNNEKGETWYLRFKYTDGNPPPMN